MDAQQKDRARCSSCGAEYAYRAGVYHSEQVVHYGDAPEQLARSYYGFYISWSWGEDDSAYPFNNAERRADWEKAVREAFRDPDNEYDAFLAAAMVACLAWGPERSRDGIDWALHDHYGEHAGALRELSDRFDPSEPPGTPLKPEEPVPAEKVVTPVCPQCNRIMSNREQSEQGACNDCHGGAC